MQFFHLSGLVQWWNVAHDQPNAIAFLPCAILPSLFFLFVSYPNDFFPYYRRRKNFKAVRVVCEMMMVSIEIFFTLINMFRKKTTDVKRPNVCVEMDGMSCPTFIILNTISLALWHTYLSRHWPINIRHWMTHVTCLLQQTFNIILLFSFSLNK